MTRETPAKIFFHACLAALLLAGCMSSERISREEVAAQSRSDAVVSSVLFERDLDTTASYNIRKNGLVVIRFDASVPARTYTEVVNTLRANPSIVGVQATQAGVEVCPLTH